MRGILFKLTGLILLASSLVAGWFAYEYRTFVETPLAVGSDARVLDIAPGTSVPDIGAELVAQGLISKPYLFVWAARASGQAHALKAGEYRIEPGMTPPRLLDLLVSGKVVQHAFTIVEGWSVTELRDALRGAPRLVHTLEDASDEALMQAIGASGEHAEGAFLPDTYHYPSGTTDVTFLARAYRAMQDTLQAEWEARAPGLPLESPYEALVLASIIEKETGVASERPDIAGVFVRRLRKGMRLETDPTVIYGVGESFDGNLTRTHLRADTPYNTYTRHGLPPTPIALPGRAAIHAALNPADGETLFFVSRGDGTHEFSVTYDQHRKAVAEYQLRRRSSSASSQ